MKRYYLIITCLVLLLVNVLKKNLVLLSELHEITTLDKQITHLAKRQAEFKLAGMWPSPEALTEKQELTKKVREYITLREKHRYYSSHIVIGSDYVFTEVMKSKMYEAMGLNFENIPLYFVNQGVRIYPQNKTR